MSEKKYTRDQIKNAIWQELKESNYAGKNNDRAYEVIGIVMAGVDKIIVGEEQTGAAWVKATTLMPTDKKRNYIFRQAGNIRSAQVIYLDHVRDISDYTKLPIDNIEWLDESGTAAAPTAWVRADVKRPEGWQLARFHNSKKRFPVKFAQHVIADMAGKTYEPQELEYLSDEGTGAAGRGPNIDELWDEHSELIDDDIDSLTRWAGSSVVDKEQFRKLVARMWDYFKQQNRNNENS